MLVVLVALVGRAHAEDRPRVEAACRTWLPEWGSKGERAAREIAQRRFAEAAALLLEVADDDSSRPWRATALNNAAVALEADGRPDAAIGVWQRLLDWCASQACDGDMAEQAVAQLASCRHKVGDLEGAAAAWRTLAEDRRSRGSQRKADATWNLAVVLESMGRRAEAATWFERYARERLVPAAERREARARVRRLRNAARGHVDDCGGAGGRVGTGL